MTFKTSLSGLGATQAELDVISNNIANADTTGFKTSRTEFADIYASAFADTSNNSPGTGVTVDNTSQQFNQGNIEYTGRALDLAVEGEGFFVVRDTAGTYLYTRSGVMGVDRDGYLVNSSQARLQGYMPDAAGNFSIGNMGDLQLTTSTGAPQASTMVTMGVNLNAAENYPGFPGAPLVFDPNVANSYNQSTSVIGYDSLGIQHNINYYFVKDSATSNRWFVYAYVDGTAPADQLTSGGVSPIQLDFDTSGLLSTPMPVTYDPTTTINAATGANELTLQLDISGSTQYGSSFAVNTLSQDGFTTGNFVGVAIDDTGVITARYSNGQEMTMGKIALASFPNPQGLAQLGDNAWGATYGSGDVTYGEALIGKFGAIHAGSLESSNVDIAEQLVKLIITQRNYQANAQAISTEDQMTQTIINMR